VPVPGVNRAYVKNILVKTASPASGAAKIGAGCAKKGSKNHINNRWLHFLIDRDGSQKKPGR
jgi:hypothetical protein